MPTADELRRAIETDDRAEIGALLRAHPDLRSALNEPMFAWGGEADLVDLLIERGHPVNGRDPDHGGTPIDWALHRCLHERRHPEGPHGRVIESLIQAGCPWDPKTYPTGDAGVDEVRARYV